VCCYVLLHVHDLDDVYRDAKFLGLLNWQRSAAD